MTWSFMARPPITGLISPAAITPRPSWSPSFTKECAICGQHASHAGWPLARVIGWWPACSVFAAPPPRQSVLHRCWWSYHQPGALFRSPSPTLATRPSATRRRSWPGARWMAWIAANRRDDLIVAPPIADIPAGRQPDFPRRPARARHGPRAGLPSDFRGRHARLRPRHRQATHLRSTCKLPMTCRSLSPPQAIRSPNYNWAPVSTSPREH